MDSDDEGEPTAVTSTITRGPSEAPLKSVAEKNVSVIGDPKAEDKISCPSGTSCNRRQRNDHKKVFRVPLKKEDGNLESQIITYNCEFPNRVVLRLEYLMHSTKVRLNDRIYMDELFTKLIEEENTYLEKASKSRERAEQNRMKKLIINGHMPEIPAELSYLKRHPVLRVNRLLARLNAFDDSIGIHPDDEEDNQLTPVEPYEYDGNKFFKTLHDEGIIWMPSCQLIHNENKLTGKVYRAKLRLLQKRKEQEANDTILQLLNADKEENLRLLSSINLERDNLKKLSGPEISVQEAFNLRKSNKLFGGKREIDKIKRKLRQEVSIIKERIQDSKELELQSEAYLDSKRREQEIMYMDTFDHELTSIMTRYHEREIQRDLEDILKTKEYIKQYQEEIEGKDAKKKSNLEPNKKKVSVKRTSGDNKTNLAAQPSFQRIKEAFEIEEDYPFHHFEEYKDPRLEQIDKAETMEELVKEGDEITQALFRQEDQNKENEEDEDEENEEEQEEEQEEELEEEQEDEPDEDDDDQEE